MEKINLYGASGHAKVITDIIRSSGNEVGVFYDDCPHCDALCERPVISAKDSDVVGPLIIAIGANSVRCKIANHLNVEYACAVHPQAIISPTAHIGEGSVVMAGAIVETEAEIGRHCIVNTSCSINHECKIDDFVHISPGATLCGNVHVGEGSWVGAGSTVIPGITIGKNVIIGAGSTVIRDIPDNCVAVGVPAKIIKHTK